jgi:hypothetical protein
VPCPRYHRGDTTVRVCERVVPILQGTPVALLQQLIRVTRCLGEQRVRVVDLNRLFRCLGSHDERARHCCRHQARIDLVLDIRWRWRRLRRCRLQCAWSDGPGAFKQLLPSIECRPGHAGHAHLGFGRRPFGRSKRLLDSARHQGLANVPFRCRVQRTRFGRRAEPSRAHTAAMMDVCAVRSTAIVLRPSGPLVSAHRTQRTIGSADIGHGQMVSHATRHGIPGGIARSSPRLPMPMPPSVCGCSLFRAGLCFARREPSSLILRLPLQTNPTA